MTHLTITIEGPTEQIERKFAKEFRDWMDNQGEQDWWICADEHFRGFDTNFTYPKDSIHVKITPDDTKR